jgi:predicted acyl esterase
VFATVDVRTQDRQSEPLVEGVRVMRHDRIPMRDGARLAADVYLPDSGAIDADAGSWPAVVTYHPYRKGGAASSDSCGRERSG